MITSYAQSSIEFTTGITVSKLNFEGDLTVDNVASGSSVFANLGYQYQFGKEARMALVFSTEFLKRNSTLTAFFDGSQFDISVRLMQIGVTPKFRYFFGKEEDKFRAFLSAGLSYRFTVEATESGFDIFEEDVNDTVLGGVYNTGFDWSLSTRLGLVFEAGIMNDFQDNLDNFYVISSGGKTKFFDYYLRTGVRYRF